MISDRLSLALSLLFFASHAGAADVLSPQGITLQGTILDSNNNPEESPSVEFTIQIRSPGVENCLLYQEKQTVNMTGSGGAFSLVLGTGARSGGAFASSSSLSQVFNNSSGALSSLSCSGGTSYVPVSTDSRKVVLTFDTGSGPQTVTQTLSAQSVPYALSADSLQGKTPSNFLQVNGSTAALTQANAESVFSSASAVTELVSLIGGSSAKYVTAAGGNFTPSANMSLNSKKITNLADPTSAQDAATKNYCDAKIAGAAADTASLAALAAGDSGKVLTWNGAKWIAQSGADATKVAKTGDTMTGALTMNNANIALSGTSKITGFKSTGIDDNASANAMTIDSSGHVGIGTASPSSKLTLQGNDESVAVTINNTDSATARTPGVFVNNWMGTTPGGYPVFASGNSRGSSAIPTAIQNGDYLLSVSAWGGRGGVNGAGAAGSINFIATENYNATGNGGAIAFYTTTNASTNQAERMRVDHSGNVGIGTNSPASKLDVNGGIKLANDAAACDGTKSGTLRYNSNIIELCNGSNWVGIASSATNQTISGNNTFSGTSSFTGAASFSGVGPSPAIDVSNGGVRSNTLEVTGASTMAGSLNVNSGKVYLDATNGRIGVNASSPSFDFSLGGNASRTIAMERHSTADTAGNNLSMAAGGATSGATDKNGGTLYLSSGTSTGTGTSQIQFQTASAGSSGTGDNAPTTKMTVLGNGNTGIGTTNPQANLHIAATSNHSIVRIEAGANKDATLQLHGDRNWGVFVDGDGTAGPADYFHIRDYTGARSPLVIDTSGNVGIGTTSPTAMIHAYAPASTDIGRFENSGGYWSFDQYGGLKSSHGPMMGYDSNASAWAFGATGHTYITSGWANATAKNIILKPSGSGYVGIGTTSPAAALEVDPGQVLLTRTANDAWGNSLVMRKGRGAIVQDGDELGYVRFDGLDGSSYKSAAGIIGQIDGTPGTNDMPGRLLFVTTPDGSTTNIERMRIDSNGKVGIGTSSPTAKLEVVGEIKSTDGSGNNRLWGKGRPNTVRYGTTGAGTGLCTNGSYTFGLSGISVSWDNAEASCPSGTWVCTAAERGTGACDTARPDGTQDGLSAAGNATDWTASAHIGWVADAQSGNSISGVTVREDGNNQTDWTSSMRPVWCCN